jgi:hypothetical protein
VEGSSAEERWTGNDAHIAAAVELMPIFVAREDAYSVENYDKSFNFRQTATSAVIAVPDVKLAL